METTCSNCRSKFTVSAKELALIESVSPIFDGERCTFSAPELCPDCRHQRRLMYRNERRLYHRECAETGKRVISIYSPERAYTVYDNDFWWSSGWDARSYGRDFDFSRTFFDQFAELYRKVPKAARVASNNENSDYVNYALNCKNCYLILGWGENSENCLYGKLVVNCRDCVDINHAVSCELCFECVDIENCYQLFYSQDCKHCHTAYFLKNCLGCSDCFGCINLVKRQYCILNRQYTRAEYEAQLVTLLRELETAPGREKFKHRFGELSRSVPHKYYQGLNTHDCSGDYLRNCKNAIHCFDTSDTEDGVHLFDCIETKDCMDLSVAGKNNTERSYECVNYTGNHCTFCSLVWLSSDLTYCQECFHGTHDCFGCTGLTRSEYCILNKQYTKEEYHKLARKIAAHMKETGEWGRFFPAADAPFSYNESMAHESFPLSREEAEAQGCLWSDFQAGTLKPDKNAADLPPSSLDAGDEALEWVIECERSKRPFRLVRDELRFYRTHRLPLPRLHPDERHRDRLTSRNPRRLWKRGCERCQSSFETTFSPERPEKIYCEKCFHDLVYA